MRKKDQSQRMLIFSYALVNKFINKKLLIESNKNVQQNGNNLSLNGIKLKLKFYLINL